MKRGTKFMLINDRGLTILESINNDLRELSLLLDSKEALKPILYEMRGKLNLAFEFGLISEQEWERYIDKVFILLY